MALFKQKSAGDGNGQGSGATNAFNGVLVLNTGAVSLSGVTQQVALQNIPNYYGLPASGMDILISVSDHTGATAPTTPSGVSTAVYELQIYGQSGQLLLDLKGMDTDFINAPHILNTYGYYTAEVTPTEASTSSIYSWTFETRLGFSIDPSEFPLKPVVTMNTLASRASANPPSSATCQLQITMDFEAHDFVKAKLRSYLLTGVTTGIFPAQAQLDKNVNVLAQAFYFAADGNLNNANMLNFANNGVQLINQSSLGSLINKENSSYPSNPHITGLVIPSVIYTKAFNMNFSTVLQFNIATAPTIGGVANTIKAYLLETY